MEAGVWEHLDTYLGLGLAGRLGELTLEVPGLSLPKLFFSHLNMFLRTGKIE